MNSATKHQMLIQEAAVWVLFCFWFGFLNKWSTMSVLMIVPYPHLSWLPGKSITLKITHFNSYYDLFLPLSFVSKHYPHHISCTTWNCWFIFFKINLSDCLRSANPLKHTMLDNIWKSTSVILCTYITCKLRMSQL